MGAFNSPADIVNRGLQHLGATRISALTDNSKNAAEAAFAYDKCRRAELRANPWNFSARRVVIRPYQGGMIWGTSSWSSVTTYPLGGIVFFNGLNWVSSAAANLGVTPGTGNPVFGWAEFPQPQFISPFGAGTQYYAGEMVTVNTNVYIATGPTAVAPPQTPWVLSPGLSLATPTFFFPAGITTNTLNKPKTAYPMPVGYIRVMPQEPKSASMPAQLSTAGMQNADFEFEGGFLYTAVFTGPMVFRFATDLQNVVWFDDLFCEALACRVALELSETITQSAQKVDALHSLYLEYVEKAVRVNAIEAGSTEPDTNRVDSQRGPTREKAPQQPRQQQQ